MVTYYLKVARAVYRCAPENQSSAGSESTEVIYTTIPTLPHVETRVFRDNGTAQGTLVFTMVPRYTYIISK